MVFDYFEEFNLFVLELLVEITINVRKLSDNRCEK